MEIEIIDKEITFIKKCFVIELELNGKVFEISIQENCNTNLDFFDIDWDFLDFEDLEEKKKPTDEEIDFIDDWVRKYGYEKYGEDKK